MPPESVSVRFVGLTGDKSSVIHLKMLAHEYPFDTVQLPFNCFDATCRSFEEKVLPELERRGIAPLGMSRRPDRPVRQLAPRARPPHLSRV